MSDMALNTLAVNCDLLMAPSRVSAKITFIPESVGKPTRKFFSSLIGRVKSGRRAILPKIL